jgi:hypothetical protein
MWRRVRANECHATLLRAELRGDRERRSPDQDRCGAKCEELHRLRQLLRTFTTEFEESPRWLRAKDVFSEMLAGSESAGAPFGLPAQLFGAQTPVLDAGNIHCYACGQEKPPDKEGAIRPKFIAYGLTLIPVRG